MSTYLRNSKVGSSRAVIGVVTDNWDLDVQLRRLLVWLEENLDFHFGGGEWIVDVGYEPRAAVTVAGYTINVELMTLLSKKGITLWLSDYGKTTDEDAHISRDSREARGKASW